MSFFIRFIQTSQIYKFNDTYVVVYTIFLLYTNNDKIRLTYCLISNQLIKIYNIVKVISILVKLIY